MAALRSSGRRVPQQVGQGGDDRQLGCLGRPEQVLRRGLRRGQGIDRGEGGGGGHVAEEEDVVEGMIHRGGGLVTMGGESSGDAASWRNAPAMREQLSGAV